MSTQTTLPISNFVKGLITEANLLAFPDGASFDELNMRLLNDGTRERRLGIDVELNGVAHATGLTDEQLRSSRIAYHDWPAPDNDTSLHIGVIQIGTLLFFIDVTKENPSAFLLNGGNSIDLGLINTAIVTSTNLTGFLVLSSNASPVSGYLTYDPVNDIVTLKGIELKIRDLYGVDDKLRIDERPVTLTNEHKYNLLNQGWGTDLTSSGIFEVQEIIFTGGAGNSTTSITIGGIVIPIVKQETVQQVTTRVKAALEGKIPDNATLPITVEQQNDTTLRIIYAAEDGNVALITFSDQGTSLLSPPVFSTITEGILAVVTTPMEAVFNLIGKYPSNADNPLFGRNPDLQSPDVYKFDAQIWLQNSSNPTGEAAKGHYIIDAFNRNSSRVSSSGVFPLTSDDELGRPALVETHAGRVFYSGFSTRIQNRDKRSLNLGNVILFSQIVTGEDRFGNCYQANAPTDPVNNEVLSSDGGVIQISGMSPPTRLISSSGNLYVFSENGVWEISARDGFTALSFEINRISNIGVISPYSIVEVDRNFIFWARPGIYRLARNQFGIWETESLTDTTIRSLYNSVSDESKRFVKGYFDLSKDQIRWMYKASGSKLLGNPIDAVPPPVPVISLGPIEEIPQTPPLRGYPIVDKFNDEFVLSLQIGNDSRASVPILWHIVGDNVTGVIQPILSGVFPEDVLVAYNIVKVNDTTMVAAVTQNGSNTKLILITRTGSNLVYDTPVFLDVSYSGTANHHAIHIKFYEQTKFIIVGQTSLGGLVIKTISIVGGVFTELSSFTFTLGFLLQSPEIEILSTNKFVLLYDKGSPNVIGESQIFSINNDIISNDNFTQYDAITDIKNKFPEVLFGGVFISSVIRLSDNSFMCLLAGSVNISGLGDRKIFGGVTLTLDNLNKVYIPTNVNYFITNQTVVDNIIADKVGVTSTGGNYLIAFEIIETPNRRLIVNKLSSSYTKLSEITSDDFLSGIVLHSTFGSVSVGVGKTFIAFNKLDIATIVGVLIKG